MKRCLITGATGYIGSHVAVRMAACGWAVGAIVRPSSDCDGLSAAVNPKNIHPYDGDVNALAAFIRRFMPDVVIHLAAEVNTRPSPKDVGGLVRTNIGFGTELLSAMNEAGCRRMVNTGTYWQNYHSSEYCPVDLYAATKEAFEKIVEYYTSALNFRVITLRLFDVYGEDDVRPKLWNILRPHTLSAEPLALTAGEQLINLVHISDVSNAYLAAAEMLSSVTDDAAGPAEAHSIYDVRSTETRTLKETIEIFERSTSSHLHLQWGARPYKQREVMTPSFLHPVLPGWSAKLTTAEGFAKFNKRGGGKWPICRG